MKKFVILGCIASLALIGVVATAIPSVPAPFEVRLVATDLIQPKGIESTPHGTGMGPGGHDLFIAESGANRVTRIDPVSGEKTIVAQTLGTFPVGIRVKGGPFDQNLYIGDAFGGGVECMDLTGACTPFAINDRAAAGMDFGRGPFGNDLYVGEWAMGNIWRIDREGNTELFASLPNGETRYLKFSHDGQFGNYLYVTNYRNGDIVRFDANGNMELFARTGSPCLEGLDFSTGGAFGRYLYAGDICTGDIFRVAPDGTVELFASGFEGAADLKFVPGPKGGATLYMVDGRHSAYEIRVVK